MFFSNIELGTSQWEVGISDIKLQQIDHHKEVHLLNNIKIKIEEENIDQPILMLQSFSVHRVDEIIKYR